MSDEIRFTKWEAYGILAGILAVLHAGMFLLWGHLPDHHKYDGFSVVHTLAGGFWFLLGMATVVLAAFAFSYAMAWLEDHTDGGLG